MSVARWFGLAGMAVALMASAQKLDPQSRAEQIIQQLQLQALPRESGYIGALGVTSPRVNLNGRDLAVQSQVYSMLTQDKPIRYLHQMEPAETDVLIEGGPVDVYVFCADGRVEKDTLGTNFGAGERGVITAPPGCWKSLVLRKSAAYGLMADVVSPEFTTDRVRIGAGPEFIKRFAGKAPWATPEFLRKLIGPNWMP